MSLINQVLRDLDQRRAAAGTMPPAVKTSAAWPAAAARRGVIAMATAAVVLLAGGASTLAWSLASRSAATPPAAEPPPPAAATVAAPAPAPMPTPVIVVTAPSAASAPVEAQRAQANASVLAPALTETAAPVAKPAAQTSPVHAASTELPATLVAAAPVAVHATVHVPVPPHGEARIDKRPPARTAHERAEAHFQRGVAAHQQGELDDASTAYAAALREEAGLSPARQALAGILIAQGQADEAKRLLNDGHALAPRHAGIATMLSRLLAEQGELERAAEVLHTAAIASPSPEDRAFHAAILQRLNRHADAAELYAAALRVAPNNGVWWMGLGISLAAGGKNDLAREAFNRARSSGALSPELSSYVEQRLRQLL